jgi:simple sugar transport system permease protein
LGFPNTALLEREIWLPKLGKMLFFLPDNHRVHLGLIMGIVAAVIVWFVLSKTRWGYEIRVIGENEEAARFAGMPIARNIVVVMFISGALAGMAGMSEVAGVAHRLQRGISPGYGFTAIIIAWLAKLNPFAIILVSILFGGLIVGGEQIQMVLGLPNSISVILQGLILFFVLAGDALSKYRIRLG